MKLTKTRIAVAIMTMSAAGFIATVAPEGYTDETIVPTKNDRPTNGFGSTFNADGTPVKMGDRTDPVRALITAGAHVAKEEKIFRASLAGASLHQEEFDLYMNWTYQYGTGAWQGSPMRREILAGNYKAACDGLLDYRFLTSSNPTQGWAAYKFDASGKPIRWRFDCSTPGNKVCRGVWTRQQERHNACMELQQ